MNDLRSWDSTLVKKYSSSNHFKLLNQLRNEVKKYPLNNKKNIRSIDNKDFNQDSRIKTTNNYSNKLSSSNNSNYKNDNNDTISTVSFNNSKNFSIYNNNNDSTSLKNEKSLVDQTLSSFDSLAPTFKERLNHVDLK